jgi:hypothetical protein
MTDGTQSNDTRRRFLIMVGGGAVALPFAGLTACGSKESVPEAPAAAPAAPEPPPPPAPAAAEAPTEPAPEAPAAEATPQNAAPAAPAELPRVSESEPLAVALGYRHDAAQVDRAKYPRFEAGQACRSCIQWKGGDSEAWGPCGIFPGKLVNANGWCSTYARKA